MRFDEFVLRIPGDEFRLRFHEQLTVLAGIGPAERHALVASLVGALTGDAEGAAMTATDHTGRPIEMTALGGQVRARYLDDAGGQPPAPIGWFAKDAASLRQLLVVTADDLGVDDGDHHDDPPEIADARAALWVVDQERQAAVDARAAVEEALGRMGELDEEIRAAEADAARREYAAVVAQLDAVRAEAEAVGSGEDAAAADRELLAEAPELHRLAAAWVEAADDADIARELAADDDPIEEADLVWLATVPPTAPPSLDRLLQGATEADRQVVALRDSLHHVATASVDEAGDPAVVALASIDQQKLWTAHERLTTARTDLDRERLRIGGMGSGPTSSLVDAMEEAHRRWEDADNEVQSRRVLVIGGGALLALLALPASGIVGPLFASMILLAVVGGVGVLLGKPFLDRSRALRAEKLALEPLGAATYLTFHMRRIDATLDPTGRDRLELAEAELSLAERGWTSVGGGIDHAAAGALADQVHALADRIHAEQGAGLELAELRQVLDEERVPAAAQAQQDLLDALAPYGVAAEDVAGVSTDVVEAVVAARVALGEAARRRASVLDAEADEQEAADLLDEALVRLGYDDGVLPARFEAAGWTIERATEREAARVAARSPEVIEADLARLGAEARRLRRPEFAGVTAADAGDPDVESLRIERDALSASLAEHDRAGADLERLSARRTELAEALAEQEAVLAAERGGHAEVARVRTALLAHLARAHNVGPDAEPLPVLLDDPLAGVPAECKWELMDMLRRLGEKTQVLYLTDDAFIGAWARRRAEVEDNILLLEPVE
jgi:hypothetical protein